MIIIQLYLPILIVIDLINQLIPHLITNIRAPKYIL